MQQNFPASTSFMSSTSYTTSGTSFVLSSPQTKSGRDLVGRYIISFSSPSATSGATLYKITKATFVQSYQSKYTYGYIPYSFLSGAYVDRQPDVLGYGENDYPANGQHSDGYYYVRCYNCSGQSSWVLTSSGYFTPPVFGVYKVKVIGGGATGGSGGLKGWYYYSSSGEYLKDLYYAPGGGGGGAGYAVEHNVVLSSSQFSYIVGGSGQNSSFSSMSYLTASCGLKGGDASSHYVYDGNLESHWYTPGDGGIPGGETGGSRVETYPRNSSVSGYFTRSGGSGGTNGTGYGTGGKGGNGANQWASDDYYDRSYIITGSPGNPGAILISLILPQSS